MSETQQVLARAAPGSQQAAETSALMQRLLRFEGPPDRFLGELVSTQCRLGRAAAGAMVRLSLEQDPAGGAAGGAPPAARNDPKTSASAAPAAPPTGRDDASDGKQDPTGDGHDRADARRRRNARLKSTATFASADAAPTEASDATPPAAKPKRGVDADDSSAPSAGGLTQDPAAGPRVQAEVVAIHPPAPSTGVAPPWLSHAIELSLSYPPGGGSHVHRLRVAEPVPGGPTAHHLVVVPVQTDGGFRGVQAFLIDSDDERTVQARRQRIELSVSLLSLYEMRQTLQRREADLKGLSTATRVLTAGNDHPRFRGAGMAVCNEVASRWRAERVSLGMLSGRYVKVRAMSQTEHLSRKMELVQAIEAAMEECLDQDAEVIYPTPPETTLVSRAAAELAARHGPATVCSFPLRRGADAVGVLTVERSPDDPFTLEEVSFLRMACDLFTPRLLELSETDRWFGARWAAQSRTFAAAVVGPKHTWAKLLAVLLTVGLLVALLVPGTVRVEAPFKFQAVTQRSVPAPFDAYLETVRVDPDDRVAVGDVLATLDTAELRSERARLDAERIAYDKQAARAAREGDQVERQISEAQRDNVAAQLGLIDWQLQNAVLTAPLDGTVVVGDLRQQIGAPVQKGEVLFEVAPLESLRAELLVDDDKITDVPGVGATGRLAAAAAPDVKLPFTVEVVHPIAEVVDGRNVFRVRVKLDDTRPWARPGIEGVAKIDAHRAPLGWVWVRDAVNWVRLKLFL